MSNKQGNEWLISQLAESLHEIVQYISHGGDAKVLRHTEEHVPYNSILVRAKEALARAEENGNGRRSGETR